MKTEPELVAAANENFLASFRKVVEHSPEGEGRWFGSVFAFVTGLPISLFNGCVVVEAVDADELDVALGWLRSRDLPHKRSLPWSSSQDRSASCTSMASSATRTRIRARCCTRFRAAATSGRRNRRAGGPLEPDEFLQVCAETGLPQRVVQGLYSSSFVADPDVQLFVALLEGRPVGKSLRPGARSPAASTMSERSRARVGVGSAVLDPGRDSRGAGVGA